MSLRIYSEVIILAFYALNDLAFRPTIFLASVWASFIFLKQVEHPFDLRPLN